MANVASNIAAVQKAANDIDTANADISGRILPTLRGEVDQCAHSWKGAASGQFTKVMAEFDDAGKRLTDALTKIAEMVRQNAGSFNNFDGDLGSQLSSTASHGNVASDLQLNI